VFYFKLQVNIDETYVFSLNFVKRRATKVIKFQTELPATCALEKADFADLENEITDRLMHESYNSHAGILG